MATISLLLCLFQIYGVLSQSPCGISNANCQIFYNNGTCRYYNGNSYEDLSDQSFIQIQNLCNAFWTAENEQCTATDKLIWPVGQCGCPKCECPSTSFCCYDTPTSFNINYWDQDATLIECDEKQYDMCHYSINATGHTTVSCSDKNALNNRLSMNVSSPLSTVLTENNNTACYTFIESNNTELTCFCGDSSCNDVSNIIKPDLKPKNSCYVTDSFHNEQFWSNYVYQNNQCEMCGISITNSQEGNKVELTCKSRANCKSLLSEYGEYNDRLSGCVVTLNSSSNASTYSSSECCCDPSIDGNLCNEKFLSTGQQNPSKSNFECWKADFLTVTDDNWNSNAKRINCSYEYYKYCYIQSFGSNRYTSNCETETNCNNLKNLENNKRICCNDTDFCNEPSIFRTSSAPNVSLCVIIIWVLFLML